MTSREWIAAAAVACVVFSGAYLVQVVYQQSPQKVATSVPGWKPSAAQGVLKTAPIVKTIATEARVGNFPDGL